ncbi:MAG: hypothetical protein ABI662_01080 [Dermatophilaceae bacterium]
MNDPDAGRASEGFDQDAIFADIVAHLDGDDTTSRQAVVPGAEDPSDPRETSDEATHETSDDDPAGHGGSHLYLPVALPEPGDPQDLPTPQSWRAHEVHDEEEEHFEPQPVAPLPVGDLQFWAIIAGMCGGPLLLLYIVLFNRDAGGLWIFAAIGMSIGGFALLVSRLPGNQDDDDGARL